MTLSSPFPPRRLVEHITMRLITPVEEHPGHDPKLCAFQDQEGNSEGDSCACACTRCVGIYREVGDHGAITYRRRCICFHCNQECTNFRGPRGDVELGPIETFAPHRGLGAG